MRDMLNSPPYIVCIMGPILSKIYGRQLPVLGFSSLRILQQTSVLCPPFCILCPAFSVLRSAFYILCSLFCILYSVFYVRRLPAVGGLNVLLFLNPKSAIRNIFPSSVFCLLSCLLPSVFRPPSSVLRLPITSNL